ncbi:TPA: hypothetical protein DEQ22_03335 [Candidatus Nomurabacteria bacterium]|uniref:Uncharacterized protein n=1 Tax=Candidatus Nomurabacteria bacterium RIFOXYA2_FULL_42_12 TaxID=1801801 RepID=A0A1F6YPV7_9BACT|nr:MAG: hypothetical protein A2357_00250 [Candidatus Nomurabacteria bacterium RIFOXYB1_FULL_43_14]OGJ08368.1 MAG: hypothetical protein A2225_01365 [Candidatus Nomurabacteria bacterium RIFOXYA2_FULL_42_12]OGJ08424.1 MAG: hypothetical protein A2183_02150 [Candidatus Nomurabacteria bacterium RIFOXYA1_FULL_42_12]OGJ10283.1 MAG: hypothetical protein A2443_02875 [Candidatus Nomurabacteria bacterium RIFOXYC2_FULL_43_16]OGJ13540.1 MAG: hypothetical protein A2587_02185 [Candidatus Nomurabacteria bacteri
MEDKKPEPILVSRFLDIRKKPEINPTMEDFPNILKDERYRKHSLEEAKRLSADKFHVLRRYFRSFSHIALEFEKIKPFIERVCGLTEQS